MAEFHFENTLGGLVEGLSKLSESVRVVGEPIQAGDKLIIPATIVRAGFGAGGGGGQTAPKGDEAAETGSGGGGGGFLLLTPVFLIVDSEGERVISVPTTAGVANTIVDKLKDAAETFAKKKPAESDES
jgi:uncharacterized spore protein YtfJ